MSPLTVRVAGFPRTRGDEPYASKDSEVLT